MSGTDHVYVSVGNGQHWDDGTGGATGAAWKLTATTLDRHRPNFDAEFEALSGRLVVAWGVPTNDNFDWAVHSGTTWSNPARLRIDGELRRVALVRLPPAGGTAPVQPTRTIAVGIDPSATTSRGTPTPRSGTATRTCGPRRPS